LTLITGPLLIQFWTPRKLRQYLLSCEAIRHIVSQTNSTIKSSYKFMHNSSLLFLLLCTIWYCYVLASCYIHCFRLGKSILDWTNTVYNACILLMSRTMCIVWTPQCIINTPEETFVLLAPFLSFSALYYHVDTPFRSMYNLSHSFSAVKLLMSVFLSLVCREHSCHIIVFFFLPVLLLYTLEMNTELLTLKSS